MTTNEKPINTQLVPPIPHIEHTIIPSPQVKGNLRVTPNPFPSHLFVLYILQRVLWKAIIIPAEDAFTLARHCPPQPKEDITWLRK